VVARGFVAEVHWFLACFVGLCLALDRLFVELEKGMLFVELAKAGDDWLWYSDWIDNKPELALGFVWVCGGKSEG
jgi:hypothetical protein